MVVGWLNGWGDRSAELAAWARVVGRSQRERRNRRARASALAASNPLTTKLHGHMAPKANQLHPRSPDGRVLRASFGVHPEPLGVSIHFGSRGGTRGAPNETNAEYADGLRLLVERLGAIDATLVDAVLDSTRVQDRSLAERRLPIRPDHALPVLLAGRDPERVRLALQGAQPGVLRTAGEHHSGGNRDRAIRLYLSFPEERWSNADELGNYLVHGDATLVQATDDRELLARRAAALRGHGSSPPVGNPRAPSVAGPSARRFLRLPSIVAFVLDRARDACELCGFAPFVRDDGTTYLEVHHLRLLAHGGSDTVTNAAALCANCHRELHAGVHRSARLQTLYDRVPSLVPE